MQCGDTEKLGTVSKKIEYHTNFWYFSPGKIFQTLVERELVLNCYITMFIKK